MSQTLFKPSEDFSGLFGDLSHFLGYLESSGDFSEPFVQARIIFGSEWFGLVPE